MQKAVDATLGYCRDNDISMNISGTKYVTYSRDNVSKAANISVNGTLIQSVDTFTYLGTVSSMTILFKQQ